MLGNNQDIKKILNSKFAGKQVNESESLEEFTKRINALELKDKGGLINNQEQLQNKLTDLNSKLSRYKTTEDLLNNISINTLSEVQTTISPQLESNKKSFDTLYKKLSIINYNIISLFEEVNKEIKEKKENPDAHVVKENLSPPGSPYAQQPSVSILSPQPQGVSQLSPQLNNVPPPPSGIPNPPPPPPGVPNPPPPPPGVPNPPSSPSVNLGVNKVPGAPKKGLNIKFTGLAVVNMDNIFAKCELTDAIKDQANQIETQILDIEKELIDKKSQILSELLNSNGEEKRRLNAKLNEVNEEFKYFDQIRKNLNTPFSEYLEIAANKLATAHNKIIGIKTNTSEETDKKNNDIQELKKIFSVFQIPFYEKSNISSKVITNYLNDFYNYYPENPTEHLKKVIVDNEITKNVPFSLRPKLFEAYYDNSENNRAPFFKYVNDQHNIYNSIKNEQVDKQAYRGELSEGMLPLKVIKQAQEAVEKKQKDLKICTHQMLIKADLSEDVKLEVFKQNAPLICKIFDIKVDYRKLTSLDQAKTYLENIDMDSAVIEIKKEISQLEARILNDKKLLTPDSKRLDPKSYDILETSINEHKECLTKKQKELARKLNTKPLLAFLSCFAEGNSIEKIYNKVFKYKSEKTKVFSSIIIDATKKLEEYQEKKKKCCQKLDSLKGRQDLTNNEKKKLVHLQKKLDKFNSKITSLEEVKQKNTNATNLLSDLIKGLNVKQENNDFENYYEDIAKTVSIDNNGGFRSYIRDRVDNLNKQNPHNILDNKINIIQERLKFLASEEQFRDEARAELEKLLNILGGEQTTVGLAKTLLPFATNLDDKSTFAKLLHGALFGKITLEVAQKNLNIINRLNELVENDPAKIQQIEQILNDIEAGKVLSDPNNKGPISEEELEEIQKELEQVKKDNENLDLFDETLQEKEKELEKAEKANILYKKRIEDQKNELENAENQLKTLGQALKKSEKERATIIGKNEQLGKAINKLGKSFEKQDELIEELKEELEIAEEERDELEEKVEKLKESHQASKKAFTEAFQEKENENLKLRADLKEKEEKEEERNNARALKSMFGEPKAQNQQAEIDAFKAQNLALEKEKEQLVSDNQEIQFKSAIYKAATDKSNKIADKNQKAMQQRIEELEIENKKNDTLAKELQKLKRENEKLAKELKEANEKSKKSRISKKEAAKLKKQIKKLEKENKKLGKERDPVTRKGSTPLKSNLLRTTSSLTPPNTAPVINNKVPTINSETPVVNNEEPPVFNINCIENINLAGGAFPDSDDEGTNTPLSLQSMAKMDPVTSIYGAQARETNRELHNLQSSLTHNITYTPTPYNLPASAVEYSKPSSEEHPQFNIPVDNSSNNVSMKPEDIALENHPVNNIDNAGAQAAPLPVSNPVSSTIANSVVQAVNPPQVTVNPTTTSTSLSGPPFSNKSAHEIDASYYILMAVLLTGTFGLTGLSIAGGMVMLNIVKLILDVISQPVETHRS